MATQAPTGFDTELALHEDALDKSTTQLVDAGIQEADSGELIAFDDVKADVQSRLSALTRR